MGMQHRKIIVILIALIVGVALIPAQGATTLPVLWTAGGHSAGADSAGQAVHMAVDSSGNVTVVSGPGFYTAMVVTSYTSTGVLRWQRSVAPLSGTMAANWVEAAPNGDVIALGSTFSTRYTYAITLVRYASDGTLLWRVDPPFSIFRSSVGRLVVDSAGSTYVTFNNMVAKYDSSGILLWNRTIPAGFTTSLALGPDDSDVVVTGNFWGSANSVVASFDTATGASRWITAAEEGSNDVVVDSGKVYVTGNGYTGAGTPALAYFLTVVAYDRATGARLWRTDSSPGSLYVAYGKRIALAPDGSLVAIGYTTSTGCIDWWTVAMKANGAVSWKAIRDRSVLCYDEMPRAVFILADGTTVVTGAGGPLVGPDPGGSSYLQGVTAGYSPNGTLLWEAFSPIATVWAAPLPSGDVCATGGADALITCFRVAVTASPPAAPSGLTARLITGSIVLTWQDNAIDETAFSVERSNGTNSTNFVVLATLPANATSYSDNSFTAGTYNYRVRASNAAGNSAHSNTATIIVIRIITVPIAIMSATPSSGTAPLTVTFDGSGSFDIEGFLTSWAWAFGDGTFGTGVITTHVYSTPGTYIATLTVTDRGNASNSTAASIVVNAPPLPNVPENLTATALTRSSIGLKWTNGATDQTEVRIERCRGSGCTNFRQITTVTGTATTYTNSGLDADTTYRYRVRAYNAAGTSQYSNIAAAKTLRR